MASDKYLMIRQNELALFMLWHQVLHAVFENPNFGISVMTNWINLIIIGDSNKYSDGDILQYTYRYPSSVIVFQIDGEWCIVI